MKRGMLIAISILLLLNSFSIETYAAPLKKPVEKKFKGNEKPGAKTKNTNPPSSKKQPSKSSSPILLPKLQWPEVREYLKKNRFVYLDDDGNVLFAGDGRSGGGTFGRGSQEQIRGRVTHRAYERITKTKETTKKAKTLHWDWTLKNTTDSSIPSWTRRTEKHYLEETFYYTGRYHIETLPYCSYEKGYKENNEVVVVDEHGAIVRKASSSKNVITDKWNAHDPDWKAVYEIIITKDDVGVPVPIPPINPPTKKLEAIDELVE